MKATKITLEQHTYPEESYKILKLQNTVEYNIGQCLKQSVVKDLCDSDQYDITIVPIK